VSTVRGGVRGVAFRKIPPWLEIAQNELGEEEVPGPGNNLRIVEYHKATGGEASPDSVPWCSSFVNWVFKEAGILGPDSKSAKRWLHWGKQTGPKVGAVVIFDRGGWKGHVGFVWDMDCDSLFVLGGNQGDAVSIQRYRTDRVLGYRWPAGEKWKNV